MPIFLILGAMLLAVIIIFAFPRFSPIPYFPSNMKDRELILSGLDVRDDEVIVDLGAGDGVVIFTAASEALRKRVNTRFVAVEINPVLLLVLHLRRLFHPNRKNIAVMRADLFTAPLREQLIKRGALKPQDTVVIYLYISPWLIEQAVAHARNQFPGCRFVSYYYPIKSMKSRQKSLAGVHTLYTYR